MENYFVALVLVGFGLFGLWDFIRGKRQIKSFYQKFNFIDSDESSLDTPADSTLLGPLKTTHLFTGHYRDKQIEHCRAFPTTRGQFTLSKVKRKHNQANWAITRYHSKHPLPSFCALPKSAPEAMFLMIDDAGIDLDSDTDISYRYYVRSNHPAQIKLLLTTVIKDFLLEKELISIECIDNTVIIKRVWPADHFERRFSAELDCAVSIADFLAKTTASEN